MLLGKIKLCIDKLVVLLLILFPCISMFSQGDFSNSVLIFLSCFFLIILWCKKLNDLPIVFNRRVKIYTCLLISFFFMHIISLVISNSSLIKFHGYYWRLLALIPIYSLLSHYKIKVAKIINCLKFVVVCSLLLGLYQVFILGYQRAGFPFILNSGYYPINWGDTLLFIAIYLLMQGFIINNNQKYLLIFSLIGLLCSFLSGSRGGWVGIPFAFVTYISLFNNSIKTSRKIVGVLVISLLSLAFVYICYRFNLLRVGSAYTDLKECISFNKCLSYNTTGGIAENSLGLRVMMWKNALLASNGHMLFGIGVAEYTSVLKSLAENHLIPMYFFNNFNEEPHNELIRMFTMLGVVGAIMYCIIIFYPIMLVRGKYRALMTIFLVVFFMASLSQAILIAPITCNIFIYIIALVTYEYEINESQKHVKHIK